MYIYMYLFSSFVEYICIYGICSIYFNEISVCTIIAKLITR